MAAQLLGFACMIFDRASGVDLQLPLPWLIIVYLWHLFILPLATAGLLITYLPVFAARRFRNWMNPKPTAAACDLPAVPQRTAASIPAIIPDPAPPPALSRRQFLSAAAFAVPPLMAPGIAVGSYEQMQTFRVRRLNVDIPDLPPALDGVTIAHVTDMHIGRFTYGQKLRDVAAQVNLLKPDLVLLTGDLIDYRIDDLPAGFEMLKRIETPGRIFLCEGNHDLFQGRDDFEGEVSDFGQRNGIPLLVNDSRTLRINGVNVQILGLRWGKGKPSEGTLIAQNMEDLLPQRREDAFSILLAHHPHAFDIAAEAGLPLTLSGHTHGGQLMLTKNIGAGPLLFKYWSGLYRQGKSRLVVANGVGNWFPLRINAPAEIIHITLRSGKTA
jgi:hypothetical protein